MLLSLSSAFCIHKFDKNAVKSRNFFKLKYKKGIVMRNVLLLAVFLGFCTSSYAVDLQQLNESVDKQKAMDSVDKEKATEAVKEGDVKKGVESVDADKAKESVDTDKAVDALMK
jgi:hypothetical protein